MDCPEGMRRYTIEYKVVVDAYAVDEEALHHYSKITKIELEDTALIGNFKRDAVEDAKYYQTNRAKVKIVKIIKRRKM